MSSTAVPTTTRRRRPAPPKIAVGSGRPVWWQYRAAQRQMRTVAETLNGHRHFGLSFTASAGCYTDFTNHQTVIDPTMVQASDQAEHYGLVMGEIAHESAHGRFTTPGYGIDTAVVGNRLAILARTCNILEDQRIELAMADLHWGTEKYLRLLRRRMWEQSPDLAGSDDPSEVLGAMLHMRFGGAIRGTLSAINQTLFHECWPHVLKAWYGPDTHAVREAAETILKILGLDKTVTNDQLDTLPQRSCRRSMSGKRGDAADENPMAGAGGPGEPGSGAGTPGDGEPGSGDGQGGSSAGASSAAGSPGGTGGDPDANDPEDGDASAKDATDADASDTDAAEKAAAEKAAADAEKAAADAEKADADADADAAADAAPEPGEEPNLPILTDEELDDLREAAAREMTGIYGRGAGTGASNQTLHPRPIDDQTYGEATAHAAILRRMLERIPPKPRGYAAETGPRFRVRNELRHADRPMQRREMPTRKRRIAIGALVDCSGSMSGMMSEVRTAVMATYLAADALDVPMAVWGFSAWHAPAAAAVLSFDADAGVAPEAIGGLCATGGTVLAPPLREVGPQILAVPADRRVLLVIHDGSPSDLAAATQEIEKLQRRGVEVIGIFLGDPNANAYLISQMRTLFGQRLVVADHAAGLMTILGAFLVRILRPTA